MSLKQMLELLLKLGAGENELRAGIELYDQITKDDGQPVEVRSDKAVTIKAAASKAPSTNGNRSTRRASILPLQDWMTADCAADRLDISEDEVIRLVNDKHLDMMRFNRAPALVHVRQIAYWLEHHSILPVDTGVFDGWMRQSDMAHELGVGDYKINYLVEAEKIAMFNPHPRIVLVNAREVAALIKDK